MSYDPSHRRPRHAGRLPQVMTPEGAWPALEGDAYADGAGQQGGADRQGVYWPAADAQNPSYQDAYPGYDDRAYRGATSGYGGTTNGYASGSDGWGQGTSGYRYGGAADTMTGTGHGQQATGGYPQTSNGYPQTSGYAGTSYGYTGSTDAFHGAAEENPGGWATAGTGYGEAPDMVNGHGYHGDPDAFSGNGGYHGDQDIFDGHGYHGDLDAFSGNGYHGDLDTFEGAGPADGFDGAQDGFDGATGYSDYGDYAEPAVQHPALTAPDAGLGPGGWQAGRGPGDRRGLIVGAVTGFLAAGMAIGVATLAAAFVRPQASPIIAVGEAFIDRTPPALKNFAVQRFGENDKTVLLLGMYITIALIAMGIGILARRTATLGVVGIAAFGLFGAFVAITRPESRASDVVPSVIGGIAGVAALLWLERASAPTAGTRVSLAQSRPGAARTPRAARTPSTAQAPSTARAPRAAQHGRRAR